MDSLRVLLVPFHLTNLLMVGIFSVLFTICLWIGSYGWFAAWFLQVWVFKYCYVLIEQLADGATEPPVMDTDMLSAGEARPWIQAALLVHRRLDLLLDRRHHGDHARNIAPRAVSSDRRGSGFR